MKQSIGKIQLLIFATAAVTVCTIPTHANNYRYEVDASYSDQSGGFTDVRSRVLSGTYYFSPVDDSRGPLALAPFIERASNVKVFAADRESDFSPPPVAITGVLLPPDFLVPTPGVDFGVLPITGLPPGAFLAAPFAFSGPTTENNRYGVALEYVDDNAWIVSGELAAHDAKSSQFVSGRTEDGLSVEVGVGHYVSDLMTVTLSYRYSDLDAESTFLSFSCPPTAACSTALIPFADGKIKDRFWSLDSRYLLPLGGAFHEFTGTVGYGVRAEDLQPSPEAAALPNVVFPIGVNLDRLQLAAGYTFYPRPDLGFGVDVTHMDAEGQEQQSFALHGTWFVTPAIAASASYMRSNTNSSRFAFGVEDIDGFELSLTGRF